MECNCGICTGTWPPTPWTFGPPSSQISADHEVSPYWHDGRAGDLWPDPDVIEAAQESIRMNQDAIEELSFQVYLYRNGIGLPEYNGPPPPDCLYLTADEEYELMGIMVGWTQHLDIGMEITMQECSQYIQSASIDIMLESSDLAMWENS